MHTETEAMDSLKARDLRVWQASLPFDDSSLTAIPPGVSSGPVLSKTASPALRAMPSEATHHVTLDEKKTVVVFSDPVLSATTSQALQEMSSKVL